MIWRMVRWLLKAEIQRLCEDQARLASAAYVQGVRDGYEGAAQMLEIQGWESSNQPAVVRASGQYLADGLERRGEYGWLPPHVWLQPLFVHP